MPHLSELLIEEYIPQDTPQHPIRRSVVYQASDDTVYYLHTWGDNILFWKPLRDMGQVHGKRILYTTERRERLGL